MDGPYSRIYDGGVPNYIVTSYITAKISRGIFDGFRNFQDVGTAINIPFYSELKFSAVGYGSRNS